MSKLVRWDTPFTDSRYPSVGLIISHGPDEIDLVRAIVAPLGINRYPKYLVNFGSVIAFTCMEEAFCPPRDFGPSHLEENGLSAYEYLNSPWLQCYEKGAPFLLGGAGPFHHYVIFGGDNNIEVVTRNIPTIDRVEQKTPLVMDGEI